ncbi:MAG: hypothetical protein LH606_22670, partial [Cytophagaceae bacterium]|nr:hypothetical protein [Cytophagaceae bacterium]
MKHLVLTFLFYGLFFAPAQADSPPSDKPSPNAPFACTVTVSSTTNGVICPGSANATLTANPVGGVVPYTYVWKRGAVTVGGNTQNLTATQAGTYTVSITSSGGCAATSANFEVSTSTLAAGTITGNNQICAGGTTTLTANPSGSSGYTYQWKRAGVDIPNATGNTYAANQTGAFTVVIGDVNTCSVTSSPFTIIPTTLSATVTGNNFFCAGGTTTLTANPTPATPNNGTYTYSWKLGGIEVATGKTYATNQAGNYTVTVSRSDGACSVTTSSFAVSASNLTASLSGATNALCAQAPGNSRTLTASSTGGTGTKTYRFYLNGNPQGAASATATYNATATGSYTVQVQDDNCSVTSSAIVLSLSTLSAGTITGGNTICPGGSTELTANPSGGTGPYTYQWKLNGVDSPGATNQKFLVAAAGNYTVAVTDANGCQVTSGGFAVSVSSPTVSISGNNAYCQGSSTNLTATPVSGTGPYSFQWKLGANNVGVSTTNPVLVANQPGSYTVVVTDARGCTATSNALSITENPAPTANAGPGGSRTGTETYSLSGIATASGGTGPYTYSWSTNPGVTISPNASSAQPVIGPFTQNTSIALSLTDSKGCTASNVANVTFTACPLAVVASISAGTDVICVGGSTTLSSGVTNSSGTVTYQWQQNSNNIPSANGTTFQTSAGGNYRVVVTDGRSCTAFSNVIGLSNTSLNVNAVASTDVICAGASVTVSANVGGNSGAISYQWQKDNANIPGANGNTYATSTGGSYRVIVTDSKGCTATSNAVSVSNSTLAVSTATSSPVACPANPATLTATVTGNNGGINYQWQKDN